MADMTTTKEAPERAGPKTTVKHSCNGCRYLEYEYFAVQDDTGYDKWCTASGERKSLDSPYTWNTPDWCPFLPGPTTTPDGAVEVVESLLASYEAGPFTEFTTDYAAGMNEGGIRALTDALTAFRKLSPTAHDNALVEALDELVSDAFFDLPIKCEWSQELQRRVDIARQALTYHRENGS